MISREQLVARLTEASYKFWKKSDRTEIWKRRNSSKRVTFSVAKHFTDVEIRSTLKQAGLTRDQIDEFLRKAVAS